MTKYEWIAGEIQKRIQNGIYPPNSLLPSQQELAEEFDVSRLTVKKAIDGLVISGLLSSQRGVGTRVLHPTIPTAPATAHNGLSALLPEKDIKSHIIQFDVTFPNEALQQKLQISGTQPIYDIHRLRIVDGKPFVLERTYMPVDLVPSLTKNILEGSIYQYLQEELKIRFAGAYRTIRADRSNKFDWKYLNCETMDPVLEVLQSVYLNDGRIIEYSTSRNRYDQNSYSVLDVIDAQN